MLRNSVKTILAIALVVCSLTKSMAQDKVVDQIIAVVGNNIVLKSDIENQYLQNQVQGITSDGDMKCEVLEDILEQKLLLAEAELDTNIIVTDNQINSEMDRRMQYFIEHMGSEKEVAKYFGKPIVQVKADMEETIRDQQMTQQMHGTITKDVNTTPSEVRRHFRLLPADEIPMVKKRIEYAQITVIPEITEEEDLRVKTRLRELKKRIENGDNFATLAVLYSEGPSAKDGGEIGYAGRASLDPAFAAEAFNLKKGKVSKVVRSEFGYHIIQIIDRKGEKINCRHILMKPRVDPEELKNAKNRIDTIADFIRKDEIRWEAAAYRYSFDKKTRNNEGLVINPYTGSSKFEMDQLNPDVSKIISGMNINEISDPFLTIDDKQRQVYKIIKLIDVTEEHKANLSEDYQMLSEIYLAKKKEKVYKKWIAEQQAKTYIRIDGSYVNCNFKLKSWIK